MTSKFNWMFQRFVFSVILLMPVNASIFRLQHTQPKISEKGFNFLKTATHDPELLPSAFDEFPLDRKLAADHFSVIKIPRCGLPRNIVLPKVKWTKFDLSWCLEIPSQKLPVCEQRGTLELAFRIWSRSTVFRFAEVRCNEADIRFIFNLGYPSNEYQSDGEGGHQVYIAMTNTKKDELKSVIVYFDEAEHWGSDDTREASVLFAAAHAIGHSLGLGHSSDQRSIMIYSFNYPVSELSPTDKISLQRIYGKSVMNEQENQETPTIPKTNETTKNYKTQTIVPEATEDSLNRSSKPEVDTTTDSDYIQAGRSSLITLDLKNKQRESTRDINHITNNPDSAISPKEMSDQHLTTVIISNTIPQSTETPSTENLRLRVFPKSKVDYIQTGSSSLLENVLNKITSKNKDVNRFIHPDSKMAPPEQTDETVNNVIIPNTSIESTKNNLNKNLKPETETESELDYIETGSTSLSRFALKNNKDITHIIQPGFNTVPTYQIDEHLNTLMPNNNVSQSPLNETYTKSITDYFKTGSISLLKTILKFETRDNQTATPTIHSTSRITTKQMDQHLNNVNISDTNRSHILFNETQLLTHKKDGFTQVQKNLTDSKALKYSSVLSDTLATQQKTVTTSKPSLLQKNGTFFKELEYSSTVANSVGTQLPTLKPSIVRRVHTTRPYSKTLQYSSTPLNIITTQPPSVKPSIFRRVHANRPYSKTLQYSSTLSNIIVTQPPSLKPSIFKRVHANRPYSNTLQYSSTPSNIIVTQPPSLKLSIFRRVHANRPYSQTLQYSSTPSNIIVTQPPSLQPSIFRRVHANRPYSQTLQYSSTPSDIIVTQLPTLKLTKFSGIHIRRSFSKELGSSRPPNIVDTKLPTFKPTRFTQVHMNHLFAKTLKNTSTHSNIGVTKLPTVKATWFNRVHVNRIFSKTLEHSSRQSNIVAVQSTMFPPTRFNQVEITRHSKSLGDSSRPTHIVDTQFSRVNINRPFLKTLQDSPRLLNILTTQLPMLTSTRFIRVQRNHSFSKKIEDNPRSSNTLTSRLSVVMAPSAFVRIQRRGSKSQRLADSPATSGVLTTQLKPKQTQFSQRKLTLTSKTLIPANSKDLGLNATLTPSVEQTELLYTNGHDIDNTSTVLIVQDDNSKYQCRCDSKIDNCEGLFCWFWGKVLEVCCQFYRWICSVLYTQFD